MNYRYDDDLQSERLATRWLTLNDIERWRAFFEHETAGRFLNLSQTDSASEIAAHMISKQLERYGEQRFGLQAILHRSSGDLVGLCGLLLQTVDEKQEIEVGYHFLPEYWGNGYATEAAQLFIGYAFDNELAESVISIIDAENYASQAVAIRNKLENEKLAKWHDNEDVFIYRIFKPLSE